MVIIITIVLQNTSMVNTNLTTNLNLYIFFLLNTGTGYTPLLLSSHPTKLMDLSFLFFPPRATWCDMCWACAPKPRCHGSYTMAFSCYKTRSSSKGPVGFFLSLAGLLWSTWSSVMSAIWGSLCHGGGHMEGSITGCSSSSSSFIFVCLDPIFPVILDRWRDREKEG